MRPLTFIKSCLITPPQTWSLFGQKSGVVEVFAIPLLHYYKLDILHWKDTYNTYICTSVCVRKTVWLSDRHILRTGRDGTERNLLILVCTFMNVLAIISNTKKPTLLCDFQDSYISLNDDNYTSKLYACTYVHVHLPIFTT